ncbi:hypothetical protein IW262DRAFT_1302486 [Armillaria fumosa]|nr:hypothetical protein IW262DRAFT_1302486 [Armillaria fumosa]
MSPHFADVSKALVFNLIEPITLQLGTVQSCSKSNFGTMAKINMAGTKSTEYVNVVNIDWYDLLVGTPFMHQHGIVLDFEWKCISINGTNIPAEIIPAGGMTHDTWRHQLHRPITPRGEVLEGDDTGRTVNPLPADSPALMMAETDYLADLDEATARSIMDKLILVPKVTQKQPCKVKQVDEIAWDFDPERVEAPVSTANDVPKNHGCQLTSLKVLVEDLVTDEDDATHELHFHIPTGGTVNNEPILEWNMMFPSGDNPDMDINNRLSFIVPKVGLETIGLHEFMATMYPNAQQREFLCTAMVIDPPDDDIEHLHQHWYNDYEELLQGVPKGMPPWRVMNHEIPLSDEHAKYHYHLPRCPNAL